MMYGSYSVCTGRLLRPGVAARRAGRRTSAAVSRFCVRVRLVPFRGGEFAPELPPNWLETWEDPAALTGLRLKNSL